MRALFRIFLILAFILVSIGSESLFGANYPQQASAQETGKKKKNHKWLIPVGIGAGFAIGTLAGLQAFDESINSDQKVWTTAILSAAAGGFAGWAIAHHLDKPSKSDLRLNRMATPSISWQIAGDSQCLQRQSLTITQQADCLLPSNIRTW